ncbi:MAG: bifunctional folylpolyglutamate synthase/dihydrofolate synthase [Acidobacteriaceae bacterium]
MSYVSAVEGLFARGHELTHKSGDASHASPRKYDLAHMRVLAEALGNPQLQFASVLVAGTNGKGSTSATLASILNAAGYRAALYTSPHLIRVNERVQMSTDGRLVPIADEDFARLYFRVDDTAHALVREGRLPHPPSFFEMMTAIAFCYFAEAKAEIAVLEAGMGGRLDATNIVDPVLSIITDISLDHMEWLGDTIAAITREKAGILRANGTLITLPQHPEANQVLGEVAVPLQVRGINAADYIPAWDSVVHEDRFRNRYPVKIQGEAVQIDSPLAGQHQQRNIALAIAAATELSNSKSYNISIQAILEGIRDTQWPGRLEWVTTAAVPILLDVAHNPAGAWTLRSALAALPEGQPRTLFFGCLRDKAVTEMAQILFPLFDPEGERTADRIVLAHIDNPRAATLEEMQAAAEKLGVSVETVPDLTTGLQHAIAVTPANGLVVATGSIYLVGKVRELLLTGAATTR